MHDASEFEHLPRITSWLIGALAVGAASFALPRPELPPVQQGWRCSAR